LSGLTAISLSYFVASTLLVMVSAAPAEAASDVPVPRPKPQLDSAQKDNLDPVAKTRDESVVPPPPKQTVPAFDLAIAKKCEAALRSLGAGFSVGKPLEGESICGWPRPLNLETVGEQVRVTGEPQVRCEVALALAQWSREVVKPAASLHLENDVSKILISTSYQCRRRNNAATGKVSEHGFANGVDVTGFELKDGRKVLIASRLNSIEPARAFQAAVRGGSCAYFTTVLGPTTNAAHDNHLHLDLAIRRGGYRLCQ
jgi:hypothetical protein